MKIDIYVKNDEGFREFRAQNWDAKFGSSDKND